MCIRDRKPTAPAKRSPAPPPPEPYAGGRPHAASSRDSGYKPGTQTSGDDFDKTQALKGGADSSAMNSYDQTAANRPMGASNDHTHNVSGSHRAAPSSTTGTQSHGVNTSNERINQAPSNTQNTGMNDTQNSQTGAANYKDGTKKKSLWDKVKSSVTKKPE